MLQVGSLFLRPLDNYNVFRKVYETPILKSRTPDASPKEIELGEMRTAQVILRGRFPVRFADASYFQLLKVAKSFVLRRDATLLKNHLPPKCSHIQFSYRICRR